MGTRPKFKMPDPGEEICVEYQGFVIFTAICHDEGTPNPLEDEDCMGTIYSFNRRHVNYIPPQTVMERFGTAGTGWCSLGYYEHGLCLWHVSSEIPNAPHYDWDGSPRAGIWVPDECILEEVGHLDINDPERYRHLLKRAKEACDVYTKWCNGQVYYYIVRVYQSRMPYDRLSDYRHGATEYEDCCGGWFGMDGMKDALYHSFQRALDTIYEIVTPGL